MWERMNSWFGRNNNDDRKKVEPAATLVANADVEPPTILSDRSLLVITKDDSKAQRREKLVRSFARNNVIMTVREQDLLPASLDENDHNEDSYRGQLILPRCKVLYGSATVPNCCVICLDSYRAGDSVVWSFHSECQHAFHEECVLKYLVRIQTKIAKTPCCVCRCEFTDLEVEPRERHIRRRGRGGRRTVRTRHNLEALELPSWWTTTSR